MAKLDGVGPVSSDFNRATLGAAHRNLLGHSTCWRSQPSYAFQSVTASFGAPGTVLQLEALKSLYAERRFRFFDFTEGDGAHKALFSTHHVDCATVFLLKANARNRVLLTSQQSFNAGISQAGVFAQHLGVKAALKRLLRR